MQQTVLLSTTFVCGAMVMVLELLGFRVLAPTFGYSIYVWGNLLGLILASLSIGYLLGGRLADRSPRAGTLYRVILASAASCGAMLATYQPILEWTRELGPQLGSLVATALVYGPTMILLSMVSPFAIRLLSTRADVGAVAGRVYAVSTLGSLFGTYCAAYILLPTLGSHRTLAACFAVLLGVGVGGLLWRGAQRTAAAGVVLVPLAAVGIPERAEGVVFDADTAYFRLSVRTEPEGTALYRDGTRASLRREDTPFTGRYWDLFALGPMLSDPSDILVLGMGSGTTVRLYRTLFPGVRVHAIELDPVVVDVSRRFFALEEHPDVRVEVGDVRPRLAQVEGSYDFIEIDVFRKPLQIPFYVATTEFFALVRSRLRPGGLVMMNIAALPDTELVQTLAATAATELPHLFALPIGGQTVLIASADEVSAGTLLARIAGHSLADNDALKPITAHARHLRRMTPAPGLVPLTDDRAPIEQLAYRAIAYGL